MTFRRTLYKVYVPLQSWFSRHILYAGCVTLIQSVLNAKPACLLASYKLPNFFYQQSNKKPQVVSFGLVVLVQTIPLSWVAISELTYWTRPTDLWVIIIEIWTHKFSEVSSLGHDINYILIFLLVIDAARCVYPNFMVVPTLIWPCMYFYGLFADGRNEAVFCKDPIIHLNIITQASYVATYYVTMTKNPQGCCRKVRILCPIGSYHLFRW